MARPMSLHEHDPHDAPMASDHRAAADEHTAHLIAFGYFDGWTGAPRATAAVLAALGADLQSLVFVGRGSGGPLERLVAPRVSRIRALRDSRNRLAAGLAYLSALMSVAGETLRSLWRSSQPVVIYGATIYAAPLCLLSLLSSRVRVVVHLHELASSRTVLTVVFRQLLRLAHERVCVSEYHAMRMRQLLPGRPSVLCIANPAANGGQVPLRRPPSLDSVVFGYVGGATRGKGIRVVRQFAEMLRAYPGARLRCMLSTVGRFEADTVAALQANPSVDVAFDCPDAAAQLRSVDVLIVPTVPALYEETFGLVLTEALAAGCQVVASCSGAYPSILTLVGAGLLLDGDYEEELAGALDRFLIGYARRTWPQHADLSQFDPDRYARAWKDLIQRAGD